MALTSQTNITKTTYGSRYTQTREEPKWWWPPLNLYYINLLPWWRLKCVSLQERKRATITNWSTFTSIDLHTSDLTAHHHPLCQCFNHFYWFDKFTHQAQIGLAHEKYQRVWYGTTRHKLVQALGLEQTWRWTTRVVIKWRRRRRGRRRIREVAITSYQWPSLKWDISFFTA